MLYRIKAGSRERGETLIGGSPLEPVRRGSTLGAFVAGRRFPSNHNSIRPLPKCTSGRMRAGWPEQKTQPQPSGWNTLRPCRSSSYGLS